MEEEFLVSMVSDDDADPVGLEGFVSLTTVDVSFGLMEVDSAGIIFTSKEMFNDYSPNNSHDLSIVIDP